MPHHCILSIGSNYEAEKNLTFARKLLAELYADIRFSNLLITEAIGLSKAGFFTNQTAGFTTEKEAEEVKITLKSIEKQIGRTLEETRCGVVRIDVDLVCYDHLILKPADWERSYFQQGLNSLAL